MNLIGQALKFSSFLLFFGGVYALISGCNGQKSMYVGIRPTKSIKSIEVKSDSDLGSKRKVNRSKAEEKAFVDNILNSPEEGADCAPQPGIQILRRLTNSEYRATVVDLLQDESAGSVVERFPPQTTREGFDNNAQLNVVSTNHIDVYWDAANKLADIAVGKIDSLVSCPQKDEACAQTFINDFGKRVFRRPLSGEEVTSLTNLFQVGNAAKGFDEGIKLTATALFNSPHFLYRSEVGQPEGEGYVLTSYEIVTALSYLILGTTPDTTLLQRAADNPSLSDDDISAIALELLNDSRSRVGISNFVDAYMGVGDIFKVATNNDLFPQFKSSTREAMAKETRDFFKHIVLDQLGSFADLYSSNYTITDSQELQAIYGGNIVRDQGEPRLYYNEQERLGLLGHGSFLAARTHSDSTSPVLRGAFVLERLLCDILIPPPPELDVQPPKLDPNLTTLERFKAHSQQPACAGCHQKIDGIGFGLEGYNPIGRFRTSENNRPVATEGTAYLDGGQGINFTGGAELSSLLADATRAKSCFVLQWYRYSVGRTLYEEDVCQVKKLNLSMSNEDEIKKLVVSLLANYTFRHRKP